MPGKGKQHSVELKAKVALAAVKGEERISELAARFEVHPTMIHTWKRELLERAGGLFGRSRKRWEHGGGVEMAELYRHIGHLICRSPMISISFTKASAGILSLSTCPRVLPFFKGQCLFCRIQHMLESDQILRPHKSLLRLLPPDRENSGLNRQQCAGLTIFCRKLVTVRVPFGRCQKARVLPPPQTPRAGPHHCPAQNHHAAQSQSKDSLRMWLAWQKWASLSLLKEMRDMGNPRQVTANLNRLILHKKLKLLLKAVLHALPPAPVSGEIKDPQQKSHPRRYLKPAVSG